MDAHAGNKRGFSADVSLESLRAEVAAFAEERDWNQVRLCAGPETHDSIAPPL